MNFDEQRARDWLKTNVRQFVPSNARQYHTMILTLSLAPNMLGMMVDRKALEGPVIHVEEAFSAVKTGRANFALIDNSILGAPLQEGSKVRVTPYQRRRFDGSTFLDPISVETRESGVTVKQYHIGGCASEIPLPAPKSEYLLHMRELLHYGKCSDGLRVISNLLVDAGACNLAWQEPDGKPDVEWVDPQFQFDCKNGKFEGRVHIGLNVGADVYYVDLLTRDDQGNLSLAHHYDDVYFDQMAEVLEELLCDGAWRIAKVEVLKAAKLTAATV